MNFNHTFEFAKKGTVILSVGNEGRPIYCDQREERDHAICEFQSMQSEINCWTHHNFDSASVRVAQMLNSVRHWLATSVDARRPA